MAILPSHDGDGDPDHLMVILTMAGWRSCHLTMVMVFLTI
jgi:hypothetical protein